MFFQHFSGGAEAQSEYSGAAKTQILSNISISYFSHHPAFTRKIKLVLRAQIISQTPKIHNIQINKSIPLQKVRRIESEIQN